MVTAAVAHPVDALPTDPPTLYYYLEVKDGGIVQTYPGTAYEKRRPHVPHEVNFRDMRSVRSGFGLEKNGFQLVDFVPSEQEFLDEERVQQLYYPQSEELIKKLTGASRVSIISHMCRRHTFNEAQNDASDKGDKEFVIKTNPARFVHVDQSYRGAEQILSLNLPEKEADRLTKTRWGIINVWQPIENPVKRDPLAFCDYRTLDENDFRTVLANLPPPGAGQYGNVSKNRSHKQRAEYSSNGENAARYEVANLAHNAEQEWYYASDMTPEEAWVFKIFNSKKDGKARCAAHSSFPLKSQSETSGPARLSIETRCFVFWENEEVSSEG